jgi:hypothetical protein
MEWHRHPLVIVLAVFVAALIFYYLASPYQDCMRELSDSWACSKNTSW